jgi:hypothetical protein
LALSFFLEIVSLLQSTYLCSPYIVSSIDLIQAVVRQYKFVFTVTEHINWDAPRGIISGIRRYMNFLAVIKDNPQLTAVPTIEVGK